MKKKILNLFSTDKKDNTSKFLDNHIHNVIEIIDIVGENWDGKHPLFNYIDNLITVSNSKLFLEVVENDIPLGNQFWRYDFSQLSRNIGLDTIYKEVNNKYALDLSKEYIIAPIWNNNRVISSLSKIGDNYLNIMEKPNSFEFDKNNHSIFFFYPMGLSLVHNGNHSVHSGYIKRKGIIYFDTVYDFTNLYDICSFDGEHLVSDDKTVINKIPFEMGIIFEIGRILKNNPKLYKGHPQEIMLNDIKFLKIPYK